MSAYQKILEPGDKVRVKGTATSSIVQTCYTDEGGAQRAIAVWVGENPVPQLFFRNELEYIGTQFDPQPAPPVADTEPVFTLRGFVYAAILGTGAMGLILLLGWLCQ